MRDHQLLRINVRRDDAVSQIAKLVSDFESFLVLKMPAARRDKGDRAFIERAVKGRERHAFSGKCAHNFSGIETG